MKHTPGPVFDPELDIAKLDVDIGADCGHPGILGANTRPQSAMREIPWHYLSS